MAEEKGTHNEEISDAKRLDAVMDILKDACTKIDDGYRRMDERMSAMDSRMDAMEKGRMDAAKRDEEEEGEKAKADARRKDTNEDRKATGYAEGDDDGEEKMPRELAADRKDSDEEENMADDAPLTAAQAKALREEIAAMSAKVPGIVSTADRAMFAAIQEAADPVFQAFGDRAPAPLMGETTAQYKRRLGAKMQPHSQKWKDVQLSTISDEAAVDAIISDVYADSMQAARRGVDVPRGHLRERTTQRGGHIIVEWDGEPQSWMDSFSGNSMRAIGNWQTRN